MQLGIFFVLFLFLSNVYFKPFLKLFKQRHKRTVEDRETAEKLMADANDKLEEYKKKILEERAHMRKEIDAILNEARKEEAAIVSKARDEARKITQEAAENIARQQEQLKKQLEADVEAIARSISEGLLSRKV